MLNIRLANKDDCLTLWNWVNDPEVRRASFSSHQVTLDEHKRWFETRVKDPDTILFVAFSGTIPIGVVRFERGDCVKISVTVAPEFRGSGYGSDIIRMASDACRKRWGEPIFAHIKIDNSRSVHAFRKAGYSIDGFTKIGDVPAIVMTSP